MIEKAVELGVTHFHPVLTHQTVIRDINHDRTQKQIREAAEQCERLDVPELLPLLKLDDVISKWPEQVSLYAAVERENAELISKKMIDPPCGILIGPEGGFSDSERESLIKNENICRGIGRSNFTGRNCGNLWLKCYHLKASGMITKLRSEQKWQPCIRMMLALRLRLFDLKLTQERHLTAVIMLAVHMLRFQDIRIFIQCFWIFQRLDNIGFSPFHIDRIGKYAVELDTLTQLSD